MLDDPFHSFIYSEVKHNQSPCKCFADPVIQSKVYRESWQRDFTVP